eukprot:7616241-Pyramimonas_sp.AAC.1
MGPGSAVLGGGGACEHRHWGRRWCSHMRPRSVVLCVCVWEMHWVGETHADTAAGAFGGAPRLGHEALYWVGETHANTATQTFGGAIGPRNAALGGGDACEHRHWGLPLKLAGETHANTATGAVGGGPVLMGPRNGVLGGGRRMPMGPRNAVLGG